MDTHIHTKMHTQGGCTYIHTSTHRSTHSRTHTRTHRGDTHTHTHMHTQGTHTHTHTHTRTHTVLPEELPEYASVVVQRDEGEGTDGLGGVLYENLQPRANKDSEAARETALISKLLSLAITGII